MKNIAQKHQGLNVKKSNYIFFLISISISQLLYAMDAQLENQYKEWLQDTPLFKAPTVVQPSTALPVQDTIVVPEIALRVALTRKRTSTRLKYYAEFLCDEVNSDTETKYSDPEELELTKKTRIVLKKEPDTDKPFACNQCSQSYDTQYYLNRHIRTTHNPDRPFSCYLCKKSFKEKHHCVEHVNRHGDTRVTCPECSKPFKRNPELTRHLRDVHHIEN
jgi:uncharacterized Zn-finger protein